MSGEAGRLRLVGAELFSTRGEPVEEARFFVWTVAGGLILPTAARLRVVDDQAYADWYMGQQVMEEPGAWQRFPLHLPAKAVGDLPLVEYVQGTYLDREQPYAINDIVQFLEPADA